MYRRRARVVTGENEEVVFADNSNMNPLYQEQARFENPLYTAPDVDAGFAAAGTERYV